MSDDEPTRRLYPSTAPTRRLEPDYDDEQPTVLLDGARGAPVRPHEPGDDDRPPRWGLPLIIGVVSFMAGGILALLLTGTNETVSVEALAQERARSNAALQDAQAQIYDRDARIAELEGQRSQADADEQAALSAQQEALAAREDALDAREQALDDREQAGEGGPIPDPDLPGVDLPDVSLPDIELPDSEESRNLVEQLLDRLRALFD